ncbi:5' nucleotidase, NT5C type [Peribacillus sp. SCS-37]|uniref:5' nucleotidase, NT5C type n=1 Tax=Paraperibacillus esterisolvens TaxID=3115296 RepID=UPI00390638FB
MQRKRLGIDIDGTLTRPDALLPYINKKFQLNLTLKDITQYNLHPLVNTSREIFSQWFKETEPEIYAGSQAAEGAKEALRDWKDEQDLYIISARSSHLMDVTQAWFSQQEIDFHHIELIGSHNKVATAKKHGIDIFFEDKHDNAVDISEECGIPVILFNTPYNQDPVPDNVIRVNNWTEAKAWVDGWLKIK